jgi:hypothetical protein
MSVRIPHEVEVRASWLPAGGVGAFLLLYFWAASLYPGGTRADHQTRGYSHLSNYWCDLLDHVSYSGAINAGRPFAVLATIIWPLSLVPLWLQVPMLFRHGPALRWLVRITGPASMLVWALVFTHFHDLVINVASILGFIAIVATILGLVGTKNRALVRVGLLPMSLAMTNYLMWQTGSLLWLMPLVQKAAFTSSFFWIVAASSAVRRSLYLTP